MLHYLYCVSYSFVYEDVLYTYCFVLLPASGYESWSHILHMFVSASPENTWQGWGWQLLVPPKIRADIQGHTRLKTRMHIHMCINTAVFWCFAGDPSIHGSIIFTGASGGRCWMMWWCLVNWFENVAVKMRRVATPRIAIITKKELRRWNSSNFAAKEDFCWGDGVVDHRCVNNYV